ncbi:hypothetical protein [Pseudomonas bohemica]|uniref:hypothetical protein n=1 Tax=Pseudomonas bohemica TaxID=2044872 RepID=UPI000DA6234A|nr:hypothetical protein [Pseudomonas bohemica]
MHSHAENVVIPRELLQDLIDSAQLEVDERVRAYGEDYRPHVLAAQRKVVADASAILAAPAEDVQCSEVDSQCSEQLRIQAEDVRAVGDEPVLIQAVAVTREDEDEGLRLEWLLEGGISELELAGTVLFAMPEANDLCDEDGSAELYRHPQRPVVLPDVDKLAEIIRRVDGSHSLGAGSLAEKILDEFARLNP